MIRGGDFEGMTNHKLALFLLDCTPMDLPHIICALDPMGQPIRNRSYGEQVHKRAVIKASNAALQEAYKRAIKICVNEGLMGIAAQLANRMPMFEGRI